MQFSARISDREVLAAGVLVLGGQDRDMIFVLDGMEFVVRLTPRPAPLDVQFIRQGSDKHLIIEIRGAFPAFSASWRLTGVAQAGARQIDLDVMVYSLSDQPESDRQVTFCFTAHPAVGTPVRPAAAATASGYDFRR